MQAHGLGYALTFGECYRSDEQAEINAIGEAGRQMVATAIMATFPRLALALTNNGSAGGIRTSLHGDRLAIDLNLFKGGKWLNKTEDFRQLGEYWESLHPFNAWGGRFTKPDGNHFSMTWQGRK